MSIFNAPRRGMPQRNKFDLEEENKLTCNMGTLVPIYVKEVVPGDHFEVSTACMVRCLALVAATMTHVDVYVETFYVPNRLVWKNFPDFITGGPDGSLATSVVPPKFLLGDVNGANVLYLKHSSLLDYLGFPTIDHSGPHSTYSNVYDANGFNILPVLVYNKIFDDWYRDQTAIDSPVTEEDWFGKDGVYDSTEIGQLFGLSRRAWAKDYYTTVLPFAQRGNPVTVSSTGGETGVPIRVTDLAGASMASKTLVSDASGILSVNPPGTTHATLLDIQSSFTIEDFRVAAYLQMWLEKNNTGGARFYEQIYAHFGVDTEDARLQRAEYLAGYKAPMVISEVLQTAPFVADTVSETPTAQIAGHGISIGSARWKHFIPEHGYVMTIMSVMPRANYCNNMPPMWTRLTNAEYLWPTFAHLGERIVRKHELFNDWSEPSLASYGGQVLGYQSQYSDYKTGFSQIHGQMKETLAYWTQARIFDSDAPPVLNTDFLYEAPRTDIFAVQTNVDNLVVSIKHNISARRPLPYFGVPHL